MKGETDPELAMCLAGGGGLGYLHLGLLEAMEELGLRPSLAVGTSMGAVMAAFHAAGMTTVEIREILVGFRWRKIVVPTMPHRGLLSTQGLQTMFHNYFGTAGIEDLPVRLKISALNVRTGALKEFTKGPVDRCLAASCAVAGMFEPVMIATWPVASMAKSLQTCRSCGISGCPISFASKTGWACGAISGKE